MLSIDSVEYGLPIRVEGYSYFVWVIPGRYGDHMLTTNKDFKYTIVDGTFNYQLGENGKATFLYSGDGSSVKPTPRTLRVYTAAYLQPIISKLYTRTLVSETSGPSAARVFSETFRDALDTLNFDESPSDEV